MGHIFNYHAQRYPTFLPQANFDIFNETYAPRDGFDSCYKCKGAGGFMGSEYQGDPPMGAFVNTWDDCPECLGSELCPGCLQPLWLSFDQSAFGLDTPAPTYTTIYGQTYPIHRIDLTDAITNICNYPFVCLCCGWSYDPDRLTDQYYDEPDYYYYPDDPNFTPYDY